MADFRCSKNMTDSLTSIKQVANLVGCTICFNADDENFKATVINVNPVTNRLVMKDVYLISSNGTENKLPGLMTFCGNEISCLKCLKLPPHADGESSETKKSYKSPTTDCNRSTSSKSEYSSSRNSVQRIEKKTSESSSVKSDHRSSTTNIGSLPTHINTDDREFNTSLVESDRIISLAANLRGIPTGVVADCFKQFDGSSKKVLQATSDGDDVPYEFTNCLIFRDENGNYNKKRPRRFVILENIDDEFYEAIMIIENQKQIGCGFDGVSLGRDGQLCWILFATMECVFMFDVVSMDCLEAFRNGLRSILESPSILKIMHDCRQASDLLFHQFNINLINIYDTQVADVMVLRMGNLGATPKYVRSLSTCLTEYLSFSPEQIEFYNNRKAVVERDYEVWHYRPLPEVLLEAAALNVRYLGELRQATLQCMLDEFTYGVDIYLHCVRDKCSLDEEHHGERLPEEFKELDYRWLSRFNCTSSQDCHNDPVRQNTRRDVHEDFNLGTALDDEKWSEECLPRLEEIDDDNGDDVLPTDSVSNHYSVVNDIAENSLPFRISFSYPSYDVESESRPTQFNDKSSIYQEKSQARKKHLPSVVTREPDEMNSISKITCDDPPPSTQNADNRLSFTKLQLLPAGIALSSSRK